MKALRTIRLDPSDQFVFDSAAEPGEWAVTGTFLFDAAEEMTGKRRVAFRSGFVGVSSLGFSTLAVTQFIAPQELDQAVEDLARHLVERLGCPTWEQAREAAREEMNFSIALADQPENTIIAMHRRVEEGEIRETFRTLAARAPAPGQDRLHSLSKAFTIVESFDEVDEQVDLLGMMGKGSSP